MTASLIFQVATVISRGSTLRTSTHQVGPSRRVAGELTFACTGPGGVPVPAFEEWDEVSSPRPADEDRRGNLATFAPQRRRDYSAFGAARAFVAAVPLHEVHIALRRGEQAKRGAFVEKREVEVYRVRPRARVSP